MKAKLSWRVVAELGALVLCTACGRDVSAPCPKPWANLDPARAETLTVGTKGAFWIPTNVLLNGRRFQWSSDRPGVASVPADANPQLAPITAVGRGEATILAIDLNSPDNCSDIWAGSVVVR
ncbi:MAG TPA: hypothetical protein VI259_08265 [Gemmatimonadaceae bacterium]